jgi:two-component system sensor histidine kinase/response regulator
MTRSTKFQSLPVDHSSSAPAYRVLVVEDHVDTRVMLKIILEMLNFDVLEAMDGETAFTIATEEFPDLILMDAGLPSIDGLSVTRKIREDKKIGHVPIVFLSGHALPSSREAALEAGGNDYLVKPINIDEMLIVIAKWLTPQTNRPL